MISQALGPKAAPVVGSHLVKCIHDIVEGIGLDLGRPVLSSVEEMAEIVDRFLALRLLTNDRIYPQPIQDIFVVVIQRTSPGIPLAGRTLHSGHTVGSILQIAPDAA